MKIKALRCKKCKKLYLLPVDICSNCEEISTDFIEEKIDKKGKIYSFTVVRIPSRKFKDSAPYILAIIELDCGIKLISRVICSDFNKIEIDKPVKLASIKETEYLFELIA